MNSSLLVAGGRVCGNRAEAALDGRVVGGSAQLSRGFAFRVEGLGLKVWDCRFAVEGSAQLSRGFAFRVEGLGLKVWDCRFAVEGSAQLRRGFAFRV